MNCAVPDHVNMMVSYTRKKFSTCYNVKYKTVFNHEHENVCFVSCREESYQPDYIGELGKKFLEQTKDQNGKVLRPIFLKFVWWRYVSLFPVMI